jgi:hypothetical protein
MPKRTDRRVIELLIEFLSLMTSIDNTIDTGTAFQKRLNNIRAHFKGLFAYIDINLNLKWQSSVARYKDIYVVVK